MQPTLGGTFWWLVALRLPPLRCRCAACPPAGADGAEMVAIAAGPCATPVPLFKDAASGHKLAAAGLGSAAEALGTDAIGPGGAGAHFLAAFPGGAASALFIDEAVDGAAVLVKAIKFSKGARWVGGVYLLQAAAGSS